MGDFIAPRLERLADVVRAVSTETYLGVHAISARGIFVVGTAGSNRRLQRLRAWQ